MKSFIGYLKEQMLREANYLDMFKAQIAATADSRGWRSFTAQEIEAVVKEAKKILKKDDRIIWYLKLFRACVNLSIFIQDKSKNFSSVEEAQREVLKIYPKDLHWLEASRNYWEDYQGLNTLLGDDLAHFFSLNLHEIEKVIFKDQSVEEILSTFRDIERNWKESIRGLIPRDDLSEDDEEIIRFSDGYGWWLLPRESCSVEGEAMGHCGNAGNPKAGDRILSLRKEISKGGETFYQPTLTFIIRKDGFFSEMKGRGNDKPSEKYHSYIVRLLQDKQFKGIMGGGYLADHNFAFSDLSQAQQHEVLSANPYFIGDIKTASPEALLKHPDLIRQMMDEAAEYANALDSRKMRIDGDKIILNSYEDAIAFIEDAGDGQTARWLRKFDEDGQSVPEWGSYANYYTKELFEALPSDLEKKVRTKFKIDEDADIETAIEENDELADLLRSAVDAGYSSATYNNLNRVIENVVDDVVGDKGVMLVDAKNELVTAKNKNLWMPCLAKMFLKDFVAVAKDIDTYDGNLTFYNEINSRNYNIEYDYDEKEAIEYIKENL